MIVKFKTRMEKFAIEAHYSNLGYVLYGNPISVNSSAITVDENNKTFRDIRPIDFFTSFGGKNFNYKDLNIPLNRFYECGGKIYLEYTHNNLIEMGRGYFEKLGSIMRGGYDIKLVNRPLIIKNSGGKLFKKGNDIIISMNDKMCIIINGMGYSKYNCSFKIVDKEVKEVDMVIFNKHLKNLKHT